MTPICTTCGAIARYRTRVKHSPRWEYSCGNCLTHFSAHSTLDQWELLSQKPPPAFGAVLPICFWAALIWVLILWGLG
jgi:hypothetical protein